MKKWILVAPWGDPINWSKVKYKISDLPIEKCDAKEGENKEEIEPEIIEDFSTTSALAKYLYKHYIEENKNKCLNEKIDLDIIVIASESLVKPFECSHLSNYLSSLNYDEVKSKITWLFVKDYIKSCVKEYLDHYIKKFFALVNDKDKDYLYRKIKLIIAPGVGLFEKWGTEFRGDIKNYIIFLQRYLIEHILNEVRENDINKESKEGFIDTIFLDISHGINYMPVATTNIIEDVADMIVILKDFLNLPNKDLVLIYLNSDPYVQKGGETKGIDKEKSELNINIILSRKILLREVLQRFYEEIYEVAEGMKDLKIFSFRLEKNEKPRNINDKIFIERYTKEILGKTKLIITALNHGLLLPFLYTFLDMLRGSKDLKTLSLNTSHTELHKEDLNFQGIDNIKEKIIGIYDKIISLIDENTDIKIIPSQKIKLLVKRKTSAEPTILSLLAKSLLFIYSVIKKLNIDVKKFFSEETSDRYYFADLATLVKLNRFFKDYYVYSEIPKVLIGQELDDIKLRVRLVYLVFKDHLKKEEIIRYKSIYDSADELLRYINRNEDVKIKFEEIKKVFYKDHLTEEDLKKLDEFVFNIFKSDITDGKKCIDKLLDEAKKKLSCEGKSDVVCDEILSDERFKRNFIAHAGFERDITFIKIDGIEDLKDIYIGYKYKCWENIREIIKNI